MSPESADLTAALVAGVKACRQGQWRTGHQFLTEVARSEDSSDPFPGYIYSYLGICLGRVEGRKREAVDLCRYGVELSPQDPECRLNLARAYLMNHKRRPALKQINAGLRLSPTNRRLLALRNEVGYRRKPFFPFLSRDFILNRLMGRLTYQFEQRRKEQLELDEIDAEVERLADGR